MDKKNKQPEVQAEVTAGAEQAAVTPAPESPVPQPVAVDLPVRLEPSLPMRTRADVWRESIGIAISEAQYRIEAEQGALAEMKERRKGVQTEIAEQEKLIHELTERVVQLALDMKRIREGTYRAAPMQRSLFPMESASVSLPGAEADAKSELAGSASEAVQMESGQIGAGRVPTIAEGTPLARLVEYGAPAGLLNAIASSQLAAERKLDSIGDLLAAIQADDYWFKKIKGMGEGRRDKLIDALAKWGVENSEPESDGRVRQCNREECQGKESQGVFVDGRCPECKQSDSWCLVTPESGPGGEE